MKRFLKGALLTAAGLLMAVAGIGDRVSQASARTLSRMDLAAIRGGDGIGWTCTPNNGACAEDCVNNQGSVAGSRHVIGPHFPTCSGPAFAFCENNKTFKNLCTEHLHDGDNCTGEFTEAQIDAKGGCC